MQKNNIEILCTRPLNELLIQKAFAKNIFIDVVAFVETEPTRAPAILAQIQELANQKITAVFTSTNAVEAIITQFSKVPDWTIYCLGGITKDVVYYFFGEPAVAETAKNATALAEKITRKKSIKEVVFFCGDHRLDDLPEMLRFNNITVHELVVYKTIQLPLFIEKDYDAILFFSPSAVHSFFSMNTIRSGVTLFSIGNTTAATIQTYCANKIIISEWPGKEQMIENVISYFG